ncbi:MAG: hypothetical protein AB3K77_08885 [Methanosarcinaceae archaeon]
MVTNFYFSTLLFHFKNPEQGFTTKKPCFGDVYVNSVKEKRLMGLRTQNFRKAREQQPKKAGGSSISGC